MTTRVNAQHPYKFVRPDYKAFNVSPQKFHSRTGAAFYEPREKSRSQWIEKNYAIGHKRNSNVRAVLNDTLAVANFANIHGPSLPIKNQKMVKKSAISKYDDQKNDKISLATLRDLYEYDYYEDDELDSNEELKTSSGKISNHKSAQKQRPKYKGSLMNHKIPFMSVPLRYRSKNLTPDLVDKRSPSHMSRRQSYQASKVLFHKYYYI